MRHPHRGVTALVLALSLSLAVAASAAGPAQSTAVRQAAVADPPPAPVVAATVPAAPKPAAAATAGQAIAPSPGAALDPTTAASLAAALEKQEAREEVTAPVFAQVVKQAPKAALTSGTGDVDTAGTAIEREDGVRVRSGALERARTSERQHAPRCVRKNPTTPAPRAFPLLLLTPPSLSPSSPSHAGDCAGDIDNFCATVPAGEGRLAACLTKQGDAEAAGNSAGAVLSADCKLSLAALTRAAAANINADLALARACKADVEALCGDVRAEDGSAALACLTARKEELSAGCGAQVFRTQLAAAKDWRADARLAAACEKDAVTHCGASPAEPSAAAAPLDGVSPAAPGSVGACLRAKAAASLDSPLSVACQVQVFRARVEAADDVRLDLPLAAACAAERSTFCKGVAPGGGRVAVCLESARASPGFGDECKARFEDMMAARSRDFRLDAALRAACAADADAVCGYALDEKTGLFDDDPLLVACLQDHAADLPTPACEAAVRTVMARAASDIRFDVGSEDADPLADACAADRAKLCGAVPPGSARVMRCLADAPRGSLSSDCAASLFDAQARMAESIDFKAPLLAACAAELAVGGAGACSGVPHKAGAAQRCLSDAAAAGRASPACAAAVTADAARAGADFRLNHRLRTACAPVIPALCGSACPAAAATAHADAAGPGHGSATESGGDACGGRVLACLADKADQITDKACAAEVFYFVRMEVSDYRTDVPLAEACRADVASHCPKTPPGQVLACLRAARPRLSEACRTEELRLAVLQARDVRLVPALGAACASERARHCAGVPPGKGRVLACLARHAASPDFGAACAAQVRARVAEIGEASYRADYALAAACEGDAAAACAPAAAGPHAETAVLGCLVSAAGGGSPAAGGGGGRGLSPACAPEVARAARLALWGYEPGHALTAGCDADVAAHCSTGPAAAPPAATTTATTTTTPAPSPPSVWSIGSVGRCLSSRAARGEPLAPTCRALVAAAAPDDARDLVAPAPGTVAAVGRAALARIAAAQAAAGLPPSAALVDPHLTGFAAITLTGWGAGAALAGLIGALLAGTILGVRRVARGSWTGAVAYGELSRKDGGV